MEENTENSTLEENSVEQLLPDNPKSKRKLRKIGMITAVIILVGFLGRPAFSHALCEK